MADSIADAWSHGMLAGADGWPARDNPHLRGSPLADSWEAGRLIGQHLCPPLPPTQPHRTQHRPSWTAASLGPGEPGRAPRTAPYPVAELEQPRRLKAARRWS
jgi:hypothetical protein